MRSALLLLPCALTAAAPPSWRLIETGPSPYKLYVDTANVERDGPARLFIAKMVPIALSDSTEPSDIASVLVRVKIDCGKNVIEVASASMLNQGGEVSALPDAAPRSIKSGTDDMMMRKVVC
jgi:hypothetical protein